MAQDLKPSTWIPSWSEDGTDVTFPIASIPELTAAEADGATGDMRKCIYSNDEWDAIPNSSAELEELLGGE